MAFRNRKRLIRTVTPAVVLLLFGLASHEPALAQTNQLITELPVLAEAGSAEPRLSKGPDGLVVLSWLEPNGDMARLRYASLNAHGEWSAPRTVAEGDNWFVNWADFPSVLPISDSLWAAHWLSKRPGGTYAYDVSIALSHDAGVSWSEAITPHRDNTATEHGFVSIFPWQGSAGVVWLDGRYTEAAGSDHEHGNSGGMTLRAARLSSNGELNSESEIDELVCDCCQTGVATTKQGLVAVYRNRTEAEIRDIYVSRYVDEQWQPGKVVSNDDWEISGCPVNGPAIAAHEDVVVVAWFTMAKDIPKVQLARSEDGGQSFSAVQVIDESNPLGRVDVALLSDGTAVVSWLDEDSNGQGAVSLRLVQPNGKMAPVMDIAITETGRPGGFPQMVNDGDTLVMAWTDTSGPESLVKSVRISLIQPEVAHVQP